MLKVFIFSYNNQKTEILLNLQKIKCARNTENGFMLECENHQIFHHQHFVNLAELARVLDSEQTLIDLNELRINL